MPAMDQSGQMPDMVATLSRYLAEVERSVCNRAVGLLSHHWQCSGNRGRHIRSGNYECAIDGTDTMSVEAASHWSLSSIGGY
jgi:hypothetical protein